MLKKIKRLIRRFFIRETIVERAYKDKNNIIYEIKLKKFWHPLRNIRATLNNETELAYSLPKFTRKIKIVVPIDNLKDRRKSHVNLIINGKKMWLKENEHSTCNLEWFIYDNNFYENRTYKRIIIYNAENEKVNNKTHEFNKIEFSNQEIMIELEQEAVSSRQGTNSELYTLTNGVFNKLQTIYDAVNNQMVLTNFDLIKSRNGYLFLKQNEVFYPVSFAKIEEQFLNTEKHKIVLEENRGLLKLKAEIHELICDKVEINQVGEDKVKISFSIQDLPESSNYQLLMSDNLGNQQQYDLHVEDFNLYCMISKDDLFSNLKYKRFSLLIDQNITMFYRLLLKTRTIEGNGVQLSQSIQKEELDIFFYRRKDKLLGLAMKRPKLVKTIEQIDDFILTGSIQGLEFFKEAEFFLILEERETAEKISIRIKDSFKIDLKESLKQLLSIKSKSKCIFDLFLEIRDGDEIVRKEKIRYPAGDYKKDNYFQREVLLDDFGNQHYFLLTITPYNNAKIESFIVPVEANIAQDTSNKDTNIWLIGERYNTAQDNGVVLFRWLQNNTSINAYYVIEEENSDYNLIRDEENVLLFGSKEHYEIASKAKVLLGTHDLENLLPYKQAKGFYHYEDTIKVFLQHGVLGRKNVEYHKKYYETPFDLFIVSSIPEKYDVVMEKLGYEENEVVVTGLARFDNLVQKEEPQNILVMPTWRDWLNTDEKFSNSIYFMNYKSLLENEKLNQVLEDHNVKLLFYPHYRARKYFDEALNLNSNNNITLVPFEEKSVQELLIESALLVTDYSSVSFDFLYLNKPVIYYQFDSKRFFKNGILRPLEDTSLGEVGKNEEDIVHYITDRIKNRFANYPVDTSTVLAYQDQKNCQRIYDAVIDKINETSSR